MNKKSRIFSLVLVLSLLVAFIYLYNVNSKNDFQVYEKNFVAMNTIIGAKLYSDDFDCSENLSEIKSLIDDTENEISYRLENSKVGLINSGKVITDEKLSKLINLCNEVSISSGGKFDLTVGKLSQLWDIGGENQKVPTKEQIKIALDEVGCQNLKINDSKIKLENSESLDFGAVGKGYACDEILSYLNDTDIDGAIVSVGGSILAYGSRNQDNDKWKIAISHPRNEGGILGTIQMQNGFVSTSGDYERFFEVDGVRYHHILDATTGYPSSSDLISVTVVAKSGALSDALSTAVFALGSEKAEKILNEFGASAVLVDTNLNVSTIGDIDFEKAN